MPDGRVLRIDPDRGSVYIVRRGRTYLAPIAEVETAARVPSARVRFGLRRSQGVETAESVTLRSGTRTNKRHRRFGDLTGATRPGSKIATRAHTEFGIDVTTQPMRVIEAWLQAMSEHHFDAATSLYIPEASIYFDGATVTGRKRIRAHLEELDWNIAPDDVVLHCADRYVSIEGLKAPKIATSFTVRDGQIVEHWSGITPQEDADALDSGPTIEVLDRSGVPKRDLHYAEERLRHLVGISPERVEGARMKLAIAPNPTVLFPASAEATIDLDGEFLRVKSAATTLGEAIDQVVSKGASKIERLRDRTRHDPTGLRPADGQWRHGNRPADLAPHFDRPPETREIVRHKTVAPGEVTIEEAAWDADLMDLEFFLFVELSTGRDCLLERTDDSYLVRGLGDAAELAESTSGPFTVSTDEPPLQTLATAMEIVDQTALPFHFFTNTATGRGNVLYRRRDGHYGLITPDVDEPLED